jgi:hypothetical protein
VDVALEVALEVAQEVGKVREVGKGVERKGEGKGKEGREG